MTPRDFAGLTARAARYAVRTYFRPLTAALAAARAAATSPAVGADPARPGRVPESPTSVRTTR